MANPQLFSAADNPREITLRVLVLAVFLTVVLAVANTYLALKIGMLTSASIPAAVLSMALLRLCKDANVLENNLVQTAASAGEAVAGGIVYTVPALIIIHYWFGFSYWDNVAITLLGGLLGVMFSIPLRATLVHDEKLPFPEGRAIAEVLKAQTVNRQALQHLLRGGLLGVLIELCQNGFKILADKVTFAWHNATVATGFAVGFVPAMFGAGYIIGFDMGLSIFLGGLLSWLVALPIMSWLDPAHYIQHAQASNHIAQSIRYFGVGAMIYAGAQVSFSLLGTFVRRTIASFKLLRQHSFVRERTEFDIPSWLVVGIVFMLALSLGLFYFYLLPIAALHLGDWHIALLLCALVYSLLFGFIFSAITAYFSGLVGVSATPGSAIIIAGLLISSSLLLLFLRFEHGAVLSASTLLSAQACVIIIGAIVTGSAAIANDNMQDLKVGYILGATPWKQQLMLCLGVVIAAFVIPPVMQLLFNVYGIADVVPRAGMDLNNTLPAPQATLMATLTQALFQSALPWSLLGAGAAAVIAIQIMQRLLGGSLSLLGIAMGMYLSLDISTALFIGGCFAWLCRRHVRGDNLQHTMLLACGLVAGAAIMDVVLALPFSLARDTNVLRILPADWHLLAVAGSVSVTLALAGLFNFTVKKS